MNSQKTHTGKVAIVTGAGQGIGLQLCRSLCEAGAKVVINDLDNQLTKDAVKTISVVGECIGVSGDASDLARIQKMIDVAVARFGKLDIAVANAGITLFGDFFSYPSESFQKVIDVNLRGTFFLAQAAANQIKKQNSRGTLLFMSSVTGHQAHKNLAAYGMTKAAIEMLARNLVAEVSPYQINVNAIAPGATLTERTAIETGYENTWSKITPMGRPATVEDIAAAAMFLTSDQARHITGQTLIVDGGWTSVSPSPY